MTAMTMNDCSVGDDLIMMSERFMNDGWWYDYDWFDCRRDEMIDMMWTMIMMSDYDDDSLIDSWLMTAQWLSDGRW